MAVWIVLGCILLGLFLISIIRVGATAEYSQAGLWVRAKLGPFRVAIYPMKQKKKAGQKQGKGKKERQPGRGGGALEGLQLLLEWIVDATGRLSEKIRVDKLYLDFTAAAEDPAVAALSFGGANAAVGMIVPFLENHFHIRTRRIRTAVNFSQKTPTVYLFAAVSMTVGQAAGLAAHLAVGFLKQAHREKQKRNTCEKEAV